MLDFYKFLEGKNKTLYHGSKVQFPIGFKLTPQSSSKDSYIFQEKEVEKIMEKYRPKNKLSRYNSVFLVDTPEIIDQIGGYEDHIYIVQPAPRIEASDLSWYDSNIAYNPVDEKVIQSIINYWMGVPYKNHTEYRTPYAIILKEI
jgi:hypothetical protein